MADDTTTSDTTAADDSGAGADAGAGDQKLTQAEVNRIVGREKAAAVRAELSRVAEILGCTVEEAKAALAAKAEADAAALTEVERREKAATDATAAAAAREAQATARERKADIRAALADANVPSKVASRLLGLVDAELGDQPADTDHITAAIEAVKADLPALFAAPDPAAGAAKPPPNGDPRGKPPAGGQPPVDQIKAQNERRLAERGLLKPVANQSA